ncbi:hypothetical protein MUG78_16980 [Gordonia alkaliphila]|uniref:hypothetical protein n=1 Tax=Gordonia alkaliphila TaxID=1053547 RepID=UPI001FF65B98|nr:hypothetical protein [Gordonia alkaliphila]MCK0441096.1 hypothetical protein [Gordonia alkaliphila]
MSVVIHVPSVSTYVRQISDAGNAVATLGDTLITELAPRLEALPSSVTDYDPAVRVAVQNAAGQLAIKAVRLGDWSRNVASRFHGCDEGLGTYLSKAQAITAAGADGMLRLADGAVSDLNPR